MEVIYLQMPAADWDALVDLVETTCGQHWSEVEILQKVQVQWRGVPNYD